MSGNWPQVTHIEIDDLNEAKFLAHGVSTAEVLQVFMGSYRTFKNRNARAAERVAIGPTFGGRLLTIPIKARDERGTWRPVTAWDSRKGERTKYDQAS